MYAVKCTSTLSQLLKLTQRQRSEAELSSVHVHQCFHKFEDDIKCML